MFIISQIIYNILDVFYLTGSEPSYIKHLRSTWILHIPSQQVVCADMKEVSNSYQHIYGWHDVVVFPITDTLLFNSQLLRKLNLI